MKNYVIITLVFFCLLLSCGKNDEMDNAPVINDYTVQNILYPKNAKLKQISHVESIKSEKTGFINSEYEYDELGRISKVSYPMYADGKIVGVKSYDIYVYNDKNQLEKIMHYFYNLNAGFLNGENEIYTYDNYGNKIKMQIGEDTIYYYYKNNRLVRADEYHSGPFESYGIMYINGGLVRYTEYEYDSQGNLVKETDYSGTDDSPLLVRNYSYKSNINVKTEVFVYYNVIGKTKLREIRRYYDKNDNLIYLESQELSVLSSASSFVSKYEYY